MMVAVNFQLQRDRPACCTRGYSLLALYWSDEQAPNVCVCVCVRACVRACVRMRECVTFYNAVICSIIMFGSVCWGGNISKLDRGRLEKIV